MSPARYPMAIARTVKITRTILPRPEMAELYAKKYEVYRSVLAALHGVWNHFQN